MKDKYCELILIFVCIAVSFVGCDARPTAPNVAIPKPDVKERYLLDGTHCVYVENGGITCDWRDKKVKR